MSNNVYVDTANDSWCNRVKEKITELQRLTHRTDFTCHLQVQIYNDVVNSIKATVPMISEITLEWRQDES